MKKTVKTRGGGELFAPTEAPKSARGTGTAPAVLPDFDQVYRMPVAEKQGWPHRGAWDQEPDYCRWTDPASRLVCVVQRNTLCGTLCGYVGVPPGHRAYKAKASLLEAGAHGGLNFGAFCTDEPDGIFRCDRRGPPHPGALWWVGFDCAHPWDFQPAFREQLYPGRTYRDLRYVVEHVVKLAAQLR